MGIYIETEVGQTSLQEIHKIAAGVDTEVAGVNNRSGIHCFFELVKQMPLFKLCNISDTKTAKIITKPHLPRSVEAGKKIWRRYQKLSREIKNRALPAWNEITKSGTQLVGSGRQKPELIADFLQRLREAPPPEDEDKAKKDGDEDDDGDDDDDDDDRNSVDWRPSYWLAFLALGPPGAAIPQFSLPTSSGPTKKQGCCPSTAASSPANTTSVAGSVMREVLIARDRQEGPGQRSEFYQGRQKRRAAAAALGNAQMDAKMKMKRKNVEDLKKIFTNETLSGIWANQLLARKTRVEELKLLLEINEPGTLPHSRALSELNQVLQQPMPEQPQLIDLTTTSSDNEDD